MVAAPDLRKYPRTPHLVGSTLQPGDADLSQVPFSALRDRKLVVEEKLDGANCAVSFDDTGKVWLQSRGHWLTGGPRERHFEQFKRWAAVHAGSLYSVLGNRYVMYGEWLAAKHTVFYDQLTHYFYEFDVYDRENDLFLDTPTRHALLSAVPVVHVPVLYLGELTKIDELLALLGPSLYKSDSWCEALKATAEAAGQDPQLVASQTDGSDLAEGLYIKDEADGVVVARYKWVRGDFANAILAANGEVAGHWLDRPKLGNLLSDGVDLYCDPLSRASTQLRAGQVL